MTKKDFFDEIWKFQPMLSVSLLIAFLGVYFYALSGQIAVFLLVMLLALGLSLAAHFYCRVGEAERGAVKLLIGGYGLVALSLLCFSVRTWIGSGFDAVVFSTALFGIVATGRCVFEILFWRRRFEKAAFSKGALLQLLPVIILSLLLVILCADGFKTWIRWDSYDYYYYIKKLSYSTLTHADILRPANPAAYGFSVMYLVLDGLIGVPEVTLPLLNVLMMILGAFGVWRILLKRYGHWHVAARLALTCVYAFSPFLLGLAWTVCLENFLIFGLVLFFWGEAERLPLLQMAASILICFSKETGALSLAAIMLARLIMNFKSEQRKGQSRHEKLELSLTLPVFLCGVFWLIDFLADSWMYSNSATAPTVGNVRFNSIGISGRFMWDRLLSLLFSNFTWLLLLVVVAGFVAGKLRKKHVADPERSYFTVELAAAIAGALVPLFLFVTYNHPRYGGVFALLLVLLLPEALDRLLARCHLKAVVCGGIAALCLVQSFWTIDPLMLLVCDSIPKGQYGALCYPRNSVLQGGNFTSSISVRNQYNKEILYFDRAFDELLAEIGYEENTILIISSEYSEPTIGGYVGAEYLIFGYGYPYMEDARYVAWDNETQRRYLSENASERIHFYTIGSDSDHEEDLAEYDRWVYVQFPFYDESMQAKWWSGMNCTQIAESNVAGWRLVAFEMTKEN